MFMGPFRVTRFENSFFFVHPPRNHHIVELFIIFFIGCIVSETNYKQRCPVLTDSASIYSATNASESVVHSAANADLISESIVPFSVSFPLVMSRKYISEVDLIHERISNSS